MTILQPTSSFVNPWTRKPQEQPGNYLFGGLIYMTSGIQDALDQHDVLAIVHDLKKSVEASDGLDYLQVYTHKDGRKVWVLDNLSEDRLTSGDLTQAEKREHDYFTIMLPEEY